jgi:hypothetical protein
MKYLYKQTGVVVESSVKLDPAVFKPVTEPEEETASQEPAEQEEPVEQEEPESQEPVEQEEPEKQEPPEEKKPVKTTAKRIATRTKK